MMDSILTDLHCNLRREFGCQVSGCDLSSEEDIAEFAEMRGDSLILGVCAHVFGTIIQILLWVNAASASADSVNCKITEGNEHKREEPMFDRGKQFLLYVRDQ